MENNNIKKSNKSPFPNIDKLDFEKCAHYFKMHIIDKLNDIQKLKQNLINIALKCEISNEFIRATAWKIFLNYPDSLSNSTTLHSVLESTHNKRKDYKKKLKEFLGNISSFKGDPLGGGEKKKSKNSCKWEEFFKGNEVKHLISLDVMRTYQERDLFCEEKI